MSILGELPVTSGKLQVHGKVAYVPQESWVFAGSVRENILFGKDFEELKYQKLLNICALKTDIKMFPNEDLTEVGEQGFRLSGGQKARINLARSLYTDGDIFLLDDPLSSVDSSVSRHLFDKCINDYLKHKVRILVTHQVQFLKEASKILVMKEGCCCFLGSYQQFIESGLDFGFLLDEEKQGQTQESSISSGNGEILSAGDSQKFENSCTDKGTVKAKENQQDNDEASDTTDETKSFGIVDIKVYKKYFLSGAGPFMIIFTVMFFFGTEAVSNFSDIWLTKWTSREQWNSNRKHCWNEINKTILNDKGLFNGTYDTFNQSNLKSFSYTISSECLKLIQNSTEEEMNVNQSVDRNFHLTVYSCIILSLLLLVIFKPTLFYAVCIKASINLHHKMFKNVLRVPIAFFDTNPLGRILNRFSKDIGVVDEIIPFGILEVYTVFVATIGCLCVVSVVEPWLLLPTAVLAILFFLFRSFFLTTAREINRYEAITKNHMFSHLCNSIIGLTSIRSYKAEKYFEMTFHDHRDKHTGTWFMYMSGSRWFGFVLDWICVAYSTCVIFGMVWFSEDESYGSRLGLVIVYSLNLIGNFHVAVRDSADVENYMISTERVLEYCKLEPEAALDSTEDKKPPKNWPFNGLITFENVSLKYAQNMTVLKNLNFVIHPEEKIGIVGRTGAGKSSLISTLFRMVEPEGNIEVDGINIKDIGLNDLRKRISIIPQDPVLFTGPFRNNLDPFSEHSDIEVWQALEEACLKKVIADMPGGLESEVSEGGNNFSVGQRQLICLARAMLKKNKILVLDEATANVDPNTDSLIQHTIKDSFKHCTVLTIAHRLHTVIDFDKVMVLDAGKIKEFERPHILLQNSNSLFSHMVEMTGPSMAKQLREAAQSSYIKNSRSENRNDSYLVDRVANLNESSAILNSDRGCFINSVFEYQETTQL